MMLGFVVGWNVGCGMWMWMWGDVKSKHGTRVRCGDLRVKIE